MEELKNMDNLVEDMNETLSIGDMIKDVNSVSKHEDIVKHVVETKKSSLREIIEKVQDNVNLLEEMLAQEECCTEDVGCVCDVEPVGEEFNYGGKLPEPHDYECGEEVPKGNPKLLILGHGRHGKDTFAEILRDEFGFSFQSSSEAAAEIACFPALKGKYNYSNSEECFNDRHNHRSEWFDIITEYNTPNKAALATEILKENDIYVGMRNSLELYKCIEEGLFDLIIWVDASERLPQENSDSFNIPRSYADIVVFNNGTYEEFEEKVIKIGNLL